MTKAYERFQQRRRSKHDDRPSKEKTARGAPQSPAPGGHGGSKAGLLDPRIIYDPATALYTAGSIASIVNIGQGGGGGLAGSGIGSGILAHLWGQIPPGAMMSLPYGHTIDPRTMLLQQQAQLQQQMLQQQMYAKPQPPALPTEVKAGEILAWRCWYVRKEFDYLADKEITSYTSMYMTGQRWKPGETISTSRAAIDNGHGIHAWKERARAEQYADECRYGINGPIEGHAIAIGTVELWGQVIEHELGYRAEYAQMKDIVDVARAPYSPFSKGSAVGAMSPYQGPMVIYRGTQAYQTPSPPPSIVQLSASDPDPPASIGIPAFVIGAGGLVGIAGVSMGWPGLAAGVVVGLIVYGFLLVMMR